MLSSPKIAPKNLRNSIAVEVAESNLEDDKRREIEFGPEVNKYVVNKMRKFHNSKYAKPSVNSGHVSPSKLEQQMYMKMGKLNRNNPDKITSNTHV